MTAHFEFSPTSLCNLLRARFLSVPQYQRSYSWGVDQVTDYWSDISGAIADSRDYFMGTVVLSSEENSTSQSIIDGQQRLSTTVILLSCLRDKFRQEGPVEAADGLQDQLIAPFDVISLTRKARVRLNTSDNPFFEQLIIHSQDPAIEIESHRLIAAARQNLMSSINQLCEMHPNTWRESLSNVVGFLTERAKIVSVTASTDADAFTIFETLNDRGADLTIADLLKNYLFRTSQNEMQFVQERWIEAMSILDVSQPNRDFVTFLRQTWSSTNGLTRERDLYRNIKEKIRSKAEAVQFSRFIVESARIFYALASTDSDFWKDYPSNVTDSVSSLQDLNLEQSRPLLMAVMQHFTKSEIETCLRSIVSWSIRVLVAGIAGGGQAERYYCEAAVEIRSGRIKTTTELYDKLKPLIPSDSIFETNFGAFRPANGKILRYMLIAIEKFLQNESEPELVPNTKQDQVNLEHILPKNAKSDEWPTFSTEDVSVFAHRLGNLTLLKKSENARIGNRSWIVKKPVLSASSLKLNTSASNNIEWNKKAIMTRQIELASAALLVWPLAVNAAAQSDQSLSAAPC